LQAIEQRHGKSANKTEKVAIQQTSVGLRSRCKANMSQPKLSTRRPIRTTRLYRKSRVQGLAKQGKSKHAQGKTDKAIKTSVQGMAKAPQTTTKKRKYNKELFRVKVVARPMRINQK
jgi:hypothetical protein